MSSDNIIVESIRPDTPSKEPYCSISFLDSSTFPELSIYEIMAFRIYGAYTNTEDATAHIQTIRDKENTNDIFIANMGKIHNWNDIQSVDDVIYGVKKLDDMEKKKKESDNTKKIVTKQYQTELDNYREQFDQNKRKKLDRQKILRDVFHKKGIMTNLEIKEFEEKSKLYTPVGNDSKPLNELDKEAELCKTTDYLTVFDNNLYNYGIISIYTPKTLKGLERPIFKVRCLVQEKDINKPVLVFKKLNKLNKSERKLEKYNFVFRVGYWTPYCPSITDTTISELRLNYMMKYHLDNIKKDQERINNEIKEAKLSQQTKNEKLKRKYKKKAKKSESTQQNDGNDTSNIGPSSNPEDEFYKDIGTNEDKKYIEDIAEYLNEPELLDKFKAKETIEKQYDLQKKN